MTNSKKNIADFQKALQSKAQFIIPDTEGEPVELPDIGKSGNDSSTVDKTDKFEILEIDEEISRHLRILAEHSGRNYDELVRHALSHFLMLKGLRLREALMELYQKEISLRDL
jgi:hypothetical protein